ncbi:unnamed protein product [Acanthoscelides obtectus]|uniref:PiggyBac transposable element-derived protein domain-containing protein n=1 Tax=Acanthoscelides obtectus TaxID=200917 RepID=A0A9P0JJ40_ACAOB|nr:unnamed protein product [Acanthoscelides obtectus]CAK1672987.1 PiggyBac transposable element-derived protein 3 [Acanthoscelides obtectus]
MQNLHLNDNNNLENTDMFSKLRHLFSTLNEKFQSFASLEECHSVDESMVPYYGGHGSKQFIRGKPIRWGYKVWVGTTKKGYIEWFEPYKGSTTIISEKYRPLGLGASVVLQFADIIQYQCEKAPFHIFCDNFFTSLPLLAELTSRGLKCTGTLRENRLSDCPLEKSSMFKKKSRGSFDYRLEEYQNNIVSKWNDNSVVTVASDVTSPFPTQQVKRFSQKEKKMIHVEQPCLIKQYNENMGGVDRADQNISLYRVGIRGKKWYFCLFSHALNMAEQNAWQLHKYSGGKMDHLQFRRCIAAGLLETYMKETKRGSSKPGKYLHYESRYDRMDHLVNYQEKQTHFATKKQHSDARSVMLHFTQKCVFLSYHTKK